LAIAGTDKVESLNVSVAAGILMHALLLSLRVENAIAMKLDSFSADYTDARDKFPRLGLRPGRAARHLRQPEQGAER